MRDLASRVYEGADVIDSRDVIERIAELEEETTPPELDCTCAEEEDDDGRPCVPETATCGTCAFEWCARCNPGPSSRTPCEGYHSEDDREELARLRALTSECEGYSDWQHGETLIADSYFEEYAQQLAEDIGAVPSDTAWPACHIDWAAAADALKQDYSSVTYGDTEYWIRS